MANRRASPQICDPRDTHIPPFGPNNRYRSTDLSPEATLLIINATLLAFAYLWAYPSLPQKSWRAIMWRDAVVTVAALVLAGLLFADRSLSFSLILFDTNWFVFSFATFSIMEIPFFMWFARKYDLRFDD